MSGTFDKDEFLVMANDVVAAMHVFIAEHGYGLAGQILTDAGLDEELHPLGYAMQHIDNDPPAEDTFTFPRSSR